MPPKEAIAATLQRVRINIKQLTVSAKNHTKCASDGRTLSYLQTRIEILDKLFDNICNDNYTINSSLDEEAIAFAESNEYPLAEESYASLKLMEGLTQFQQAPIANPIAPPMQQSANEFRLPTITIPTFNGEYSAWPSFKNSFEHLVANNPALSDIQRLHYLKNNLTNDAKRLIQNYDIVEANYQAAWEKLKLRYDNKKLLVSCHLKALIHQSSQTKESSAHIRLLIDNFTDSLTGLRNLEIDTDSWDPIIIHLLIEKLSNETHALWESSQLSRNELPTLSEFLQFLENRFRTLGAIADKPTGKHVNPFDQNNKHQSHTQRNAYSHTVSSKYDCVLCNKNHFLRSCPSFLNMDSRERYKCAQHHKVCINCLAPGHTTSQCYSKMSCHKCNQRHSTLLHFSNEPPTQTNHNNEFNDYENRPNQSNSSNFATSVSQELPSNAESINLAHLATPKANPVLLATASVNVATPSGELVSLRALIDPGSQVSFITTKAVQQLQLKAMSTKAKIFGIGQTFSGTSTKSVDVIFQSKTSPEIRIQSVFLTIPQITGSLPAATYENANWPHIKNLTLADPFYNRCGSIDLLLSADIYSKIILPGIQRGNDNEPVAQNTSIGWILFGGNSSHNEYNNLSMHTCIDIDARLKRFWESEEAFSATKPIAAEDIESETHFLETFKRTDEGCFIVRLPFNSQNISLGPSREIAINRLYQMERKFIKNPQLAAEYLNFITEYETLGHMKKVTADNTANYIPHHSVIKLTSTTTKLRVVFDASRVTSTGK